jgi:hypothetical protein
LAYIISATSFSKRIFKALIGFGIRNLGLAGIVSEEVVRKRGEMQESNVLLIPLAGIVPSPTIARLVSGRQMTTRMRLSPERMLRNPKIHRQPAFCASTPPRTGPILGAAFGLVRAG